MDALIAATGAASATTTAPNLVSATWALLWTSEQETLWLLRNGLFGSPAVGASQTIVLEDAVRSSRDAVACGTLRNQIVFASGASFVVDATTRVAGPRRVEFAFTSARIEQQTIVPFFPPRTIPLPPFGRGWFDTVYVDDALRVSRDSRGDTLIAAKCR